MNLPWDKSYFKLCFYIIFTFMICYVFKAVVDGVCYALGNVSGIYNCAVNILTYITSIFSVLILGFAIAYVLNPMVDFFCERIRNRFLSVFLVYIIILGFIFFICYVTIKEIKLGGKITFVEGMNLIIENFKHNIENVYVDVLYYLERYHLDFIINYINIFKGKIYDTMNNGIRLAIFYRTLGRIATVLLGLIISFYLLKDKESISDSFKKYCKKILPEKVYKFCAVNIEDMDDAFSGYIRGQFTDGIIMSVIISVVLGIMGIKFPLIIGIISGLSNIIPYFGALIGFLLSVFMALVNGDVSKAVIVGIVIIVLQQIDGYVISPKVLEHSVKLNPVVIIIALAVGGKLFGLIGMVLAIPFVRFLKIKIEKRYQIE